MSKGVSIVFFSCLRKRSCVFFLISMLLAISLAATGCGSEQAEEASAVQVKAMHPVSYDMPLAIDFVAQMQGVAEVAVQPKVSGVIVEKYIRGGEFVEEGQPLFKIDSRQYEAAADSAHANFVKDQVTLQDARVDLERDRALVQEGVISAQAFTTQESKVAAYEASTDASEAVFQKSMEDLDDTVVYAPMSGKLALDDVAVGTYAQAGATPLVSIGAPDPIYAQFSISEASYLRYIKGDLKGDVRDEVTLTLDGGQKYPLEGMLVAADRTLDDATGNLVVKALFPNPSAMLMPGMIARIGLSAAHNAKVLLVPQHAVQQILDKDHVLVVGSGNKSVTRVVKLGKKIGDYYVIEDGVTEDDVIIVDGLTNLQGGKSLEVTMVSPEEMNYSTAPKATDDASGAQ